jgi:hypothetical protein
MRMRYGAGWLVLLAVVGSSGCNRGGRPAAVVEDPNSHLRDETDVAVGNWLNLPRQDLYQRFDDWKSTASKLLDHARADRQAALLLPKLRPTVTLPVFQNAVFSPRAGLTLPSYADDGKKDPVLALHLARFGDADGALLLTDPGDAALRGQIEALRAERNYPVEWTRLVAMVQSVSELRLANGDTKAAETLIQVHKQLRNVLDSKAATGPLGSWLLSGGHRSLEAAGVAWDDLRKSGYAADVAAALGDWGNVPAPVASLAPGAAREAVERVFPPVGNAHAVTALGGAAERAFDLLALPLPADEVEGLTAFLDGKDQLAEIAVLYRPRAGQTYPELASLAQRLAAFGIAGQDAPSVEGTFRQIFPVGGMNFDLMLVPRGSTIGGLARVSGPQPAVAFMAPDPRDFGAIHFDRSFEQNRVAVAPEQRAADTLSVTKATEVRRVAPPGPVRGRAVALPSPASLQLRRLEGYDLLAGLNLRWERGQNASALTRLALPLWAAYGAPRFEPAYDSIGGHLALVWEGEGMAYTLRLPHDADQPPDFKAEDRRGASGASEREKAAATFDRDQRAVRIAAGTPLQRLPRAFEEAMALQLGASRAEAEAALPGSQSLRKSPIDGGWSVIFLKPSAGSSAAAPQQLFVRFGPDERVAELRLRYRERAVPKGDNTPTLLARLSAAGGAPETLAAPWAGLWIGLAQQKPFPALFRWKDDTTVMTLERDGGGAEVTLLDRPANRSDGVELPPLRFTSRGVEGCSLGDSRPSVLQHWKIASPTTTADGGVVLPMPKSSPYEAVVAYFDNDKVVRVLAYHKVKSNLQANEVATALEEAWGRDLVHLGCLRRQDNPEGSLLAGFGWHDDVTRVRTFSRDSDQGPRVYTEWREWSPPSPAKGVVSAK